MPCRSDYMEPTAREIESRKVASLMLYVKNKCAQVDATVQYRFGSDELKSISETAYGDPGAVDQLTADLCEQLDKLSKIDVELFDSIVYNAKEPKSRKLADWWERHQAADLARMQAERNEENRRRRAEEKQQADDYAEYLRLKERFEK